MKPYSDPQVLFQTVLYTFSVFFLQGIVSHMFLLWCHTQTGLLPLSFELGPQDSQLERKLLGSNGLHPAFCINHTV